MKEVTTELEHIRVFPPSLKVDQNFEENACIEMETSGPLDSTSSFRRSCLNHNKASSSDEQPLLFNTLWLTIKNMIVCILIIFSLYFILIWLSYFLVTFVRDLCCNIFNCRIMIWLCLSRCIKYVACARVCTNLCFHVNI